ncbi:MAG: hypothetical protein EOO50_01030 [Flavobacterium sp.]|uniref:hypothetical protein n=1 Tax=Flavobacterium sp. TaxID=239 RepID=UPI00121FB104|nr:hypothetical protein [Flavobacterium sp.]RZJ68405.1 MAG: hypothetical protein EOO50_01030 [Flavobacterium sp.]
MRKLLFFLVLAFSIFSCSVDSKPESTEFLLPVESVEAPTSMYAGQTTTFQVGYRRPTDCHIFNGFYNNSDGSAQIVAVRALKFDQGNCMDDSENIYVVPYQFTPDVPGDYLFKFWKGNNETGAPEYLEYEVIVE